MGFHHGRINTGGDAMHARKVTMSIQRNPSGSGLNPNKKPTNSKTIEEDNSKRLYVLERSILSEPHGEIPVKLLKTI
jgi:hypothetical protein